jgi:hypothetical protein
LVCLRIRKVAKDRKVTVGSTNCCLASSNHPRLRSNGPSSALCHPFLRLAFLFLHFKPHILESLIFVVQHSLHIDKRPLLDQAASCAVDISLRPFCTLCFLPVMISRLVHAALSVCTLGILPSRSSSGTLLLSRKSSP